MQANTNTAEETIEAMARVLVNHNLYGTTHPITRRTLDQAWEKLAAHLARHETLTIALAEGNLLLQNQIVERPRATTRLLAERLQQHNVSGIGISRACTAGDFATLCELLEEPPPKSPDRPAPLSEGLVNAGIRSIAVDTAVYKRVSEDESRSPPAGKPPPDSEAELIDFFSRFRSEPLAADTEAPPAAPPSPTPPVSPGKPSGNQPAGTGKTPSPASVRDMNAFLEGRESPSVNEAMKKAGGGKDRDISAMITLFIATMVMQRREKNLDPRSFADSFLNSLKKTYQSIQENAPRGGRRAPEAIREINRGLVEWMASPEASPLPENTAHRARGLAEEAAAKAEISAAYNAYLSGQETFRRAEEQWQAVKNRYGPDQVLAAGISPEGAEPEQAPPGTFPPAAPPSPAAPVPPPSGPESEENLALQAMLSALRFSAEDEGGGVDYTREIEKLQEQIDRLIDSTAQKIDALLDKAEQLKKTDAPAKAASPEELLNMLSEAVQELLQPLSVVNCSLDILAGPRYDTLNEANRRNTISLALENSRRIETLIGKLGAVSGMPKDLHPHPEIL